MLKNRNYIAVAKFYVSAVQTFGYVSPTDGSPVVSGIRVELNPVSYKPDDPTHENSRFWTASPSGKLELSIQNPELFETFKVGEEIYLPMMLAKSVSLEQVSNALNGIV